MIPFELTGIDEYGYGFTITTLNNIEAIQDAIDSLERSVEDCLFPPYETLGTIQALRDHLASLDCFAS